MTDIIGPRQTKAVARFCPKCHSPDLTTAGLLVEGAVHDATCNSCGWKGSERELAVAPFQHQFASDEEILQTMGRDLRNLIGKSSMLYGSFLLKWGFLDKPVSGLQLATYIEAIANAIVPAVIEARRKMLVYELIKEDGGDNRPAS